MKVVDGLSRAIVMEGSTSPQQLSENEASLTNSKTKLVNHILKTCQPKIELSDIVKEQQKCDSIKPVLEKLNNNT